MNPFSPADTALMTEALVLAERALGLTSPNPTVGCVVAKGGEVVGRGFHPKPGEPHAEVFALREAGERARGADLYVTLEPCSHYGRTPPCTEAIKAAGIGRVVCAMVDPDPRVSGRGIEILRQAGVTVDVGLLEDDARRLNEQYVHHRLTGRPWVTVKWAQTLDGRIATSSGHSRWVTGEEARREGHVLRSRHDAVLVGIGTALADDPRLDVRLDDREVKQPWHVVLDSRLRLPVDARLIAPGKTIVFCEEDATADSRKALADAGVEVVAVPSALGAGLDVSAVLAELAKKDFLGVYVEGGPTVVTSFLRARLANRVVAFVAPKILGEGTASVGDLRASTMADALALAEVTVRQVGDDVCVSGLLETA